MNIIFKYILVSTIFITLLTSCAEDYLDTFPTGEVAPKTVFATADNVEGAINGIAKLMSMQYDSYGQGFNGEGTVKLYYGEYPGNNFAKPRMTGWNSIFNMLYLERNSSKYSSYPWMYYYKIISNANIVIENMDAIPDATQKQKDFLKAQALTFRAYAYSQLIQIYAERWKDNKGETAGVILRLTSDFENLPLSTSKEVYEQIYKDLDEALAGFTSSGLSPEKNFLPGLNAAHAVYARVALNREDYQTALEHAKPARNGYPLMSNSDYKAGFCEPASEWIWYCYGASDETLYYYSYGGYIAYNANSSNARKYRSCISTDLINKIPDTDVRKSLFIHPILWADADPNTDGYQNENGFTKNWDIKDRSLVNTTYNIVRSDALDPSYNNEEATKFYQEIMKYMANNAAFYATYPSRAYTNIYEHIKFAQFGAVGEGNINLFRSSEMLLIEAEANYRLNNETAAQNALIELNKNSGRDPQYTCNKTGENLFDEIRTYRGLELWGEGYDWFDMKRWGLPIQRTSIADGGSFHTNQAITIQAQDKNKWTWVIPLSETDYNDQVN